MAAGRQTRATAEDGSPTRRSPTPPPSITPRPPGPRKRASAGRRRALPSCRARRRGLPETDRAVARRRDDATGGGPARRADSPVSCDVAREAGQLVARLRRPRRDVAEVGPGGEQRPRVCGELHGPRGRRRGGCSAAGRPPRRRSGRGGRRRRARRPDVGRELGIEREARAGERAERRRCAGRRATSPSAPARRAGSRPGSPRGRNGSTGGSEDRDDPSRRRDLERRGRAGSPRHASWSPSARPRPARRDRERAQQPSRAGVPDRRRSAPVRASTRSPVGAPARLPRPDRGGLERAQRGAVRRVHGRTSPRLGRRDDGAPRPG